MPSGLDLDIALVWPEVASNDRVQLRKAMGASQLQVQPVLLPSAARRTRQASIYACIFSSVVTRAAGGLAYEALGRSMTSPDVIASIGAAFRHFER